MRVGYAGCRPKLHAAYDVRVTVIITLARSALLRCITGVESKLLVKINTVRKLC